MEGFLTLLGNVILVVLATVLICAFWAMSPVIFCHGGGQHCGEAVLESFLNTFVASPIILTLVTLGFFPSQWKAVLATLAVVVAGYLALPGLMATMKHVAGPVEQKQQWKADSANGQEDLAVTMYSFCLQGTARRLSRTSDDPAFVIEQGSLAGCAKNRQIVFDTFSSHNKSYSPEAMTALEQEFHRKLPKLVTKTRDDMRQATHQ
jgi:hypothetical protein